LTIPQAAAAAALALCAAQAQASASSSAPGGPASLHFCDTATAMNAAQQDKLLRFAAIVRGQLEASGQPLALISRNGTDLRRFGVRYSHAGFSLKASANSPWSVRQLYYACEERRPRLFDQGLPGFLFGSDDPDRGYVSLVLWPGDEAAAVERAALDGPRALRLLAATYSANAYTGSTRYQNCNQWVAELLAAAWAPLDDGDDLRARAQHWLADNGYAPPPLAVDSQLLMFVAPMIPLVHLGDHPAEDRFALRLRTSLPAGIEAFVHARVPGAQRIELCHDAHRAVIHRGWDAIPEGCVPRDGDEVVAFD